jgi:hypothetical protein
MRSAAVDQNGNEMSGRGALIAQKYRPHLRTRVFCFAKHLPGVEEKKSTTTNEKVRVHPASPT